MENKVFAGIIIAGIIVRAVIVAQGGDFLISKNIVFDDAFIFAKIASNIQAGNGFSFNGSEITTGAPPLWPFLLSFIPLAGTGAAQTASVLSGLFFILSAVFLHKTFERFFGRKFANVFSALYLLNPFFLLLSINGMETSVFIFTLSVLFWQYFKFRERPPEWKNILLFAGAGALTFLAREEGLFAFAACVLDYLLIDKRRNLIPAAKSIFTLGIFYGIFSLWRILSFGELTPSNLFVLLNTHWLRQYGILQNIGVLILHGSLLNFATGSLALALLGLFLKRELLTTIRPVWFYAGFSVLFYSLIVPIGIFRYQFPAEIFFVLGIAALFYIAAEKFPEIFKKKISAQTALALVFMVYFAFQSLNAFLVWTTIQYSGDGEIFWSNKDWAFRDAAEFANENMPPASVVALNHIGTFSWFYNGKTVDALGKIDYKVVDATKQGRLEKFLEEKGATHIIDLFAITEFEKIEKSDLVFSKEIFTTAGENPVEYLRGNHGPPGWYVAVVRLNEKTVSLLQN